MQDTGPDIQEAERALAGAVHETRTAGTAWAIRTNLDDPTGDNKALAIALERTENEHSVLARAHVRHAFVVLGRHLGCSAEGIAALLADADRAAA